MSNKNDKWSALSLKDRADLMNMYITNGISDLKEMKKHYNSFGAGGDTENEQKNSGYTTTTKQDLEDVETFNSNWYEYRDAQLKEAISNNYYAEKYTKGLKWRHREFPELTEEAIIAEGARNYINDRLNSLKEFKAEDAIKDSEGRKLLVDHYYSYFPKEAPDPEFIGPNKSPNDWELLFPSRYIYKGLYDQDNHAVIYNDKEDSTATKIHERTHASIPKIPGWSTHPILKEIYNTILQEGVKEDSYYDKISEIYARLMELRYSNKLDPSHTYTLEEIKAMREDPNFKDFKILDRYTDESILRLLNTVAQNNTTKNSDFSQDTVHTAAYGGRILSGESNTSNNKADKKLVEDVVRTTRGITGDFLMGTFPFVDALQLGHAIDAWKVMHGTGEPAPKNNNYTGAAMVGKGIKTDGNLGFVSEEELINSLGEKPVDFVDAYVYGKTPFEKQGVYRKTSTPEKHIYRSKVAKVRNEGREMPVFQTHRDTLDASLVKDLNNKLGRGLVDSLVYPNFTTEDSPFVLGDTGIYYDGNNGTVANVILDDGRVVSKALDVFDTDPSEWNYKVGKRAKQGLQFIHDNANPYIMTTPWYYPEDTRTEAQRLEAIFGIQTDSYGDVISNKGDKNGKVWELWEALEWLDNHKKIYDYVK